MMARVFLIFSVILFFGHAIGVVVFVAQADRREPCPDERLGDQCDPLCICYTCGTRHKPLTTVAPVALLEQQSLEYMPLQQMRASTYSAPFKIFHVPKRTLA
jgi:hypothetical protein